MYFAVLTLLVVGHMVSADQQQQLTLSSASADFSQRLYQRIATTQSNIVYSPYSIHSALSMTSLGARGVTANQIKDTLGVTSLGNSLHTTYKELIQQYNSQTNVHLHTGNALFINPQYTIVPEFIEDTQENYFSKIDNIDLSANGGPEKPINDYIANKTENMITDMLGPGSIGSSTIMVLLNTIFFNGTWQERFEKYSTYDQNFYLQGGAVKQVPMMHDDRSINIKRDNANGVDVAELPFEGDRFSLYIALPQQVDGIADLESLLAEPDVVDQLFTGLRSKRVRLAIPKFKIESSIDLIGALLNMGMVKAFISGQADFSGITRNGRVYINEVLHDAVIDVQETGTVAAAATYVGFMLVSAPLSPSETFIADHPFVFFLRDNQTGQILFQGKFSG